MWTGFRCNVTDKVDSVNSTMDDQHARHQAYRYALLAAINGAAAPLSIALGGIAGSYLLAADKPSQHSLSPASILAWP